jgi:LysR family hydrogen peroxide-inducible transcriptional activator
MLYAPPVFSLRQLQYAVAVAEVLSFRKAAELCHVSQPSLSSQLALLEDALGVQLFERDKRRVLLTAEGQEVVLRAKRVLVEVRDLTDVARRSADPLSGTVRIGILPTISPYLLPLLTPKLRTEFERLTIAWLEDKTGTLVAKLADGSLDAALVALEAELGEIDKEVIAKDPFVVAAAPDHPIAHRDGPAARSELRSTDVLLLDDGHCFREQALAFCENARARELEFRATSLGTLVQMVAGGAGVTLLPALSVATEVRRAELKIRYFSAPAPERTIALIWRPHSPLAATMRKVASAIRSAYPKPESVGKAPASAKRRK